MLFVGPNDLASSMGYIAFNHASIPEVQAATTRIREAAAKYGKFAGHFCSDGASGKCKTLHEETRVTADEEFVYKRQRRSKRAINLSIVARTLLL